MAKGAATITITAKFKWWFKYIYLPGFLAINWFVVNYINHDARPDSERVSFWLRRGVRFLVKQKREGN